MTKLSIFLSLAVLLFALPATAATLYVDAAGSCGGNLPCYLHPQLAVNAANADDTIRVYPGVYGTREAPHSPPHWGPNDWFAPALIVYKDGLTIEAVNTDPSLTVIESTHNVWSNPVAIQWSTGGLFHPGPHGWDAYYTTPPGITPTGGSAPNAISIIASNVTIRGFTLHRHYEGTWATYNTAGVMIGGLFAGDASHLGSDGNTVENCSFSDVWHAVYIWHSSRNKIFNNQVAALTTNHWAAISTYDGYDDAQINLGHPSENNKIIGNVIADKGIALGAWAPSIWTSNADSMVWCNTTTSVGVTYSHGPVSIGGNTGGIWQSNTDKVFKVTGVTYKGDTELPGGSPLQTIQLRAEVAYTSISIPPFTFDGSGIPVRFTVNGIPYSATTGAGGIAATTAALPPGIYTIITTVGEGACKFTDTDTLIIGPGPVKAKVLSELVALRATVTDKQDGDKIEKAIKDLQQSLDPDLWLDSAHVQPKKGEKVFQEERDAVNQLRNLLKDKKSAIPDATILGFIDRIVAADRGLAEAVIADALAANGDPKDIAKANEELAKGVREAADGKYDVAIEHYRNAWKHALHSMGKD